MMNSGAFPDDLIRRFLLSDATTISSALVNMDDALWSPVMATALSKRVSSNVIVVLMYQMHHN
jgi:hypothetical protein